MIARLGHCRSVYMYIPSQVLQCDGWSLYHNGCCILLKQPDSWQRHRYGPAWFCIIVCSHVSSKGEAMILVMLWSFQITLANLNRVPRGTSFSATSVSAGNATPTNIGFIRIRTHLHATWTPMRSTCGAIEISVCTWQIRSLKRSSSAPHALTSTSLKVNMSLGTTKSCYVFQCFF